MASRRSWVRIPSAPPKIPGFFLAAAQVFSSPFKTSPVSYLTPKRLIPSTLAATSTHSRGPGKTISGKLKKERKFFPLRHYSAERHLESLLARKYIVLKRLEFFSQVTPVTFFRPVETLS